MFKYFLFSFYITSCSLTYAAGRLPKILEELHPISGHLYRALTQRGKLCEPVSTDHQFFFGAGVWSRGLSHEYDKESPSLKSFLLHPGTDLSQFHDKLGDMLINLTEDVVCNRIKRIGKMPRFVRGSPLDRKKFDDTIRPNFVDGHLLRTGIQKTTHNKVLVSLYEETDEQINEALPENGQNDGNQPPFNI